MEYISSFYPYFNPPIVPFGSVILYLIFSKPICDYFIRLFSLNPKGFFLKCIVIIHSSILALYSLWTCYNTIPMAIKYYRKYGYDITLCDTDYNLWSSNEYNFGFWITHFYISKYYEFIDTWIILLKSQQPIFLQTFHHAGIVIFMYFFVIYKVTGPALITTTFNSFIHTLMYTYYTAAALGYKSPLKSYLTIAQIVQFIIGIIITFPLYFKSKCLKPEQIYTVAGIQLYAIILILLFIRFYMTSYSKSSKNNNKNTKRSDSNNNEKTNSIEKNKNGKGQEIYRTNSIASSMQSGKND